MNNPVDNLCFLLAFSGYRSTRLSAIKSSVWPEIIDEVGYEPIWVIDNPRNSGRVIDPSVSYGHQYTDHRCKYSRINIEFIDYIKYIWYLGGC